MRASIFLSLILIVSCTQNSANEKDISNLSDCTSMKAYLQEIHDLDQKYRNKMGPFKEKYGTNSSEYKELIELMNLTDQENLRKITQIFDEYGYPHDTCLEQTAITPILVLHHTLNADEQEEYLPFLYKNYKDGYIDEGMFLLFLDRMYIKRNGNYFQLQGAYTYEEKVDTLFTLMNLNYIKDDYRLSELK